MKKIAFVGWLRWHRRSELLARHLGATMHFVYCGWMNWPLGAPGRYLIQAFKTWRILTRERPDVVLVQNPPIFCVALAYLYARESGAQYVIDTHSGAFLSPKWRWSLALHRLLSRHALVTIAHNTFLASMVRKWECPYCVIGYSPGDYPAGLPYPFLHAVNVAVVCGTFHADEPVDVIVGAASELKDVGFYLTGDARRFPKRLRPHLPPNCHLTGYLPYDQYVGLLRGAQAVMDLTTSDHTMLMGAFEAVSLARPLIVSDWPILREYFSAGTVHVPNTVRGVCEGVRRMQHDLAQHEIEIVGLRHQLQRDWERGFAELQQILEVNSASPQAA